MKLRIAKDNSSIGRVMGNQEVVDNTEPKRIEGIRADQ